MKKFNGHVNIGRCITVYGDNAMHYAMHIWTKLFGYICFRPTTGKGKWKWYLFFSPNATPWAATFAIGGGVRKIDRELSSRRRKEFGHNFDVEKNYKELCMINGISPD